MRPWANAPGTCQQGYAGHDDGGSHATRLYHSPDISLVMHVVHPPRRVVRTGAARRLRSDIFRRQRPPAAPPDSSVASMGRWDPVDLGEARCRERGPTCGPEGFGDHRACVANASPTRCASDQVFACAMFEATAMTMRPSRAVSSDITMPPASSPLTLPGVRRQREAHEIGRRGRRTPFRSRNRPGRACTSVVVLRGDRCVTRMRRDVERRAIARQWLLRVGMRPIGCQMMWRTSVKGWKVLFRLSDMLQDSIPAPRQRRCWSARAA